MTSFLALRASVCAYLWCLIPPVCYIGFERPPPFHSQRFLGPCWIPFRKRKVASSKPALTLIFFPHLSGLNFALGASYDSIPPSQAVAWCVVSFSSREDLSPRSLESCAYQHLYASCGCVGSAAGRVLGRSTGSY